MPIDAHGTGTIDYRVTSVVLVPFHTEMPMWTPENPSTTPIEVPEHVTATLAPVNDEDPEATLSGTIIINTETIDAFDVGAIYTLTIAAPPAP